ncbi:MAG: ribonuclease III [Lachnospiraceae bacterium]|nr:ribonuclease III [Lachnospiraceae bacterium]
MDEKVIPETGEEGKKETDSPGFALDFLPWGSEAKAGQLSPLALAFLGDAVFELCIRTLTVQTHDASPNDLNKMKNRMARAEFQSEAVERILPILSETEADIYRRGRNAKSKTMAKHASMSDYRRATGFEALLGYLYLSGKKERILEIISRGVKTDEERI